MTAGAKTTICIIQPFDPRGRKIGGIESHIRETIRAVSEALDVVLIGIDEVGDLVPNEAQTVDFEGNAFTLVPLLTRTGTSHLGAARTLRDSLTLQFFLAFLPRVPRLRRLLADRRTSIELERFEFSTFGRLLGLPTVQIVHGEGTRDQPMDSLLKRYWFTNRLNEALALRVATRVVGVNPRIIERVGNLLPSAARKSVMMTVSVNTDIFALSPTLPPLAPLRIGFAGRLDAFKRPDQMVAVVAELARRLDGAVEFHYIGGSDAEAVPGFAGIRRHTVLHGTQPAREVAARMAQLHAGILVSEFEGMPVYALELLAVGRPLVTLELPQMRLIVEQEVSGLIVPRGVDDAANVQAVADAFMHLRAMLAAGRVDPGAIRAKVAAFSHKEQMTRMIELHRSIAVRRTGATAPAHG